MAEPVNRFRNYMKQATNNGGKRKVGQYSGNADRSRRFWNPQPPPLAEPNNHTPGLSNNERELDLIAVKPPDQTLNILQIPAINGGTYPTRGRLKWSALVQRPRGFTPCLLRWRGGCPTTGIPPLIVKIPNLHIEEKIVHKDMYVSIIIPDFKKQ